MADAEAVRARGPLGWERRERARADHPEYNRRQAPVESPADEAAELEMPGRRIRWSAQKGAPVGTASVRLERGDDWPNWDRERELGWPTGSPASS